MRGDTWCLLVDSDRAFADPLAQTIRMRTRKHVVVVTSSVAASAALADATTPPRLAIVSDPIGPEDQAQRLAIDLFARNICFCLLLADEPYAEPPHRRLAAAGYDRKSPPRIQAMLKRIGKELAGPEPPGEVGWPWAWKPLGWAERAILDGLRHGKHRSEIAHERGCAPRTVADRIYSILRKARAGAGPGAAFFDEWHLVAHLLERELQRTKVLLVSALMKGIEDNGNHAPGRERRRPRA